MTLQEAQHKLLLARTKEKRLREQISQLKEIIFGYGVNPDPRYEGIKERNKEMYRLHKKGWHPKKIAAKFNTITFERVRQICELMDKIAARKKEKSK